MVRARARDLERFQSTLPVGESDDATECIKYIATDFNPRSPRGERLITMQLFLVWSYFNPRSPWGERRGPRFPPRP